MKEIWIDGSAQPNPGYGGFGILVKENNNIIEQYSEKSKEITTNNIEELKALLYALKNYGKENESPIVYCDSAYAINCCTVWVHNWIKNNWLTSKGEPVKNKEIIEEFYNLWENEGYRLKIKKVKGHSGIEGNELADQLAKGVFNDS